jgi:hypothetical protein
MVDVVKDKSIIEGEERESEYVRTRPIRFVAAAAIVLLVFITPAAYRPTQVGKLRFDRQPLIELNAVKPDYVFVGNSMLGTRLDTAVLEQRLGSHCCYIMWTAGAESAWQHQALKNYILVAEHRPKRAFIFFRDTYLTRPSYRAQDSYWWRIERLSHEHEPELEAAMRASRTWQEQLEYELGLLYPIQKRRFFATAMIESAAGEIARTPKGSGSAGSRFNALFSLDRLRQTESDDTAFDVAKASYFDFQASVDSSLLPSMIRHAKEAGVELVFVRIQKRPTKEGPPVQSPALQGYIAQLQSYLARNGAGFYDFTGDPELTLDHYLDGDHIRPEWKRESTEHFMRRMQAYLQ